MSRLQTVDPSVAQGDTKALLDGVNAAFGVTPNLFRVAANSPAALNAMVQMNGALAKGVLRPKIREAIALTVAEQNACNYCLSAHSAIGKGAGLTQVEIDDARDARATDPKLQAVLTFTKLVVRSRGQISASDVQQIKDAGASDAEIAEIMGNIAFNIFTNYLNVAADTEIDFPLVSAHAAR